MSFPSNTPFFSDLPSPKHAHQQTPHPLKKLESDALEKTRKGRTGYPHHQHTITDALCCCLALCTHALRPSGSDSGSIYVTV